MPGSPRPPGHSFGGEPFQIAMTRDHLREIPGHALPEGFTLKPYGPGASRHWREIHLEADPWNDFPEDRFGREFGADNDCLAERQIYLAPAGGAPIGTATAWFDEESPLGDGRVHWVAIRPAWQGRGLAKPLLAWVCRRLAELGHKKAYLTTSTHRVAAIRLYEKFGFQGHPRGEREEAFWKAWETRPDVRQRRS